MKVAKIMRMVVAAICVGIGLFVLLLYTAIKTKTASLNKYRPFSEWVGRSVVLQHETALLEEKVRSNTDNVYSHMLHDKLDSQWQYIEEQVKSGDIIKIKDFPVGTLFKLEKAVQFTNGVSGTSSPVIFGTVKYDGKEYKTGYQWGKMSLERYFDKVEKCWQFPQAPWQKQYDSSFYALPEAKWW